MQKKFLRIIIWMIIMLLLGGNHVIAINDTDLESIVTEERISETADDPIVNESEDLVKEEDEAAEEEEEEETITIGSTNEDMDRETSSYPATDKPITSSTSQPTKTYSTIATIPEANLSLNNILNVILIAVGVILILLAIAILIRMR